MKSAVLGGEKKKEKSLSRHLIIIITIITKLHPELHYSTELPGTTTTTSFIQPNFCILTGLGFYITQRMEWMCVPAYSDSIEKQRQRFELRYPNNFQQQTYSFVSRQYKKKKNALASGAFQRRMAARCISGIFSFSSPFSTVSTVWLECVSKQSLRRRYCRKAFTYVHVY